MKRCTVQWHTMARRTVRAQVGREGLRAEAEEFVPGENPHAPRALPSPATHAIWTQLKAGECLRRSM